MGNFTKVIKKFPKTFWVTNVMELFERWAWYGLFAVLALYLTNSTDEGALGFSHAQKGSMMGTVTAILYFLPVITGAIADRLGYKKVLLVAYIILSSGYLMMGYFSSYYSVYLAFLWIAVGAALFKPVISATIVKTTNKESASIGFGLFYMIVNIGGFVGPAFASKLRYEYGWYVVFLMSASAITINMILVLLFYKEPNREKIKNNINIRNTIKKSVLNIAEALKDVKLLVFLIIMVGFWTMFNQLFYTLPNFIDQWVNTSVLYNTLYDISPGLAQFIGTSEKTIAPEMMINLDAGLIILLQIIISTLVMKMRAVNSIISGIIVNSLGIGLAFATQNVSFVIFGIMIFAIGEMAGSPKYSEYIGKLAPKGKEALYMGTSFLPVAVGNFITGFLSGNLYGTMSDKTTLLEKEIALRGLNIPKITEKFTQNDYFASAMKQLNMTSQELTDMLWNNYSPGNIWYIFSAIGIATTIALFLYDKFMLKGISEE